MNSTRNVQNLSNNLR